ncbi:SapC family protein [Aquisalinus flavus]|uniref:SapC family protein n=1 Tax=Aquisalinus flavus TaxID=1526572 RepID=A0A8J2V241_9PROT|nr:SapC family protein [Aquisalinus flavus]MBD0427078.1 SapC family protein [Aquisalinus flavus]UNE46901.1 SapC family protein [Aquisalinus flavus]GGC98201.1 SapC family protein [Aquisalinus flavus]
MPNTALLNNIDHKDLKVITRYGAEYGDSVNIAPVFPTEFVEIQRDYPILFRKDAEDQWQAIALLGLDRNENLFLRENGSWDARHVPLIHQRGPFMIGYSKAPSGEPSEPMIHVDLDSRRVSKTEGQPVFLVHGGNSPYLERVSTMLQAIDRGIGYLPQMFAAFEEAGLIEPINIEVRLDRETAYTIPDFHTIDEDKLTSLDAQALEKLHRSGALRLAYMVLSSLPNINRLIEMKNALRAQGMS